MSGIKECCQQESNLKEEPCAEKDRRILRCQVCKCRHIKVELDAGHLDLRNPPVGEVSTRWDLSEVMSPEGGE